MGHLLYKKRHLGDLETPFWVPWVTILVIQGPQGHPTDTLRSRCPFVLILGCLFGVSWDPLWWHVQDFSLIWGAKLFLALPCYSKLFFSIPYDSWRCYSNVFLANYAIPSYSLLFLAIPSYSLLFHTTLGDVMPSYSMQFPTTPCYSMQFLAMLFQAIPSYSLLYQRHFSGIPATIAELCRISLLAMWFRWTSTSFWWNSSEMRRIM